MEGWDCPFAYMLVILDNTRSQTAITQLVGRVMRQPGAKRTGVVSLDQCYVLCYNTDVGQAVTQVRRGLESEGMTGLREWVHEGGGDEREQESYEVRKIERRSQFRGRPIYLPLVLHQNRQGNGWIELDYQAHILPHIHWEVIGSPCLEEVTSDPARIRLASVGFGEDSVSYLPDQKLYIDKTFDVAWYARRLNDLVPNPWQATRIVGEAVSKLRNQKLTDESIHDIRAWLSRELHRHVAQAIDEQGRLVFERKLGTGEISFDLEAGRPNLQLKEWHSIQLAKNDKRLSFGYGREAQLGLFEPLYHKEFDSDLERRFAFYLDERKSLEWWHRVAAQQKGDYYVRGWRKPAVWPDFVAMAFNDGTRESLLVFDTKGEQLRGNDDTVYKERLFGLLEGAFNAGQMKVSEGPAHGTFKIVFEDEPWPNLEGVVFDSATA